MLIQSLTGGLEVRALEARDAAQLFDCIERNREHLRPWLVWVDGTRSVADVERFIEAARQLHGRDAGLHAGLFVETRLVGGIGCHEIDWRHSNTSLGYWLAADAQGHGYMTQAARAFIAHAFTIWRLNRMEIRCAAGNMRSRALCERLGFTAEGIKRQAESCDGGFRDLIVYSLLADEWSSRRPLPAAPAEAKGG
jgi:ribosomal-protein-serine acetyltransferase